VASHFGCPTHSHKSSTPIVFEVGVYPFHGRSFLESGLFMGIECAGVGTAAGIGIDDGHMAKGAGEFMNLRSIIGGIAEIVKAVLDESLAFLHQGNGGLAVVKGCCAQDAADGNVKIRGGDVKFVAFPCFLVTLAVALASLIAERGQVGDVFFERARGLQIETFFRSGRPDFVFARATTGFFGAFGLGGIGRGFFFSNGFPGRNGGGIDADMADDAVTQMSLDKLTLSELRELPGGKLFEGSGKSGAIGNVVMRIPAAEASEVWCDLKKGDEILGGRKIPNHFGDKSLGHGQSGERFATIAFPLIRGHESVKFTKFDDANKLCFLGGEGSEFGFESREEILLEAI